jgi:DNA repair exonuclease SbcCD ATPase subunit
MKKTPDIISKKRQQLRQQIEALEEVINSLVLSSTLTHEEKQFKTSKLNEYIEQLKDLKKEMYEIRSVNNRFNVYYRKSNLYPGVF